MIVSTTHEKKIDGMRRNLKAKTGRTLDDWLALLARDGPHEASQREAWLKSHGLGHFQARLVLTAGRERDSD